MAKKKVWVVGHKHPDTDSICAAISYANLKNEIEKKNPKTATGMTYIAKRAGSVNAETAYVLERFHAEAPAMISDVGTQIKDIQIRRTEGVNSHISMKKAWEMMKILGVVTLPVVREKKPENNRGIQIKWKKNQNCDLMKAILKGKQEMDFISSR